MTTFDELKSTLRDVLREHDRNTCLHEDTHRGGSIWTICDACGTKWADDQGGFIPYVDPPVIAKARALLDRVESPVVARPFSEWDECYGDVLWWKFPVTEPPYVGSPNDLGRTIEVTVDGKSFFMNVGGWPGYHTHWTPLPAIPEPGIPPVVDLESLRKRIHDASGPDISLAEDICAATDVEWDGSDSITQSTDDALRFVQKLVPGWDWLKKGVTHTTGHSVATLVKPLTPEDEAEKKWAKHFDGKGANFALALLSAMFEVMISAEAP